MTPSMETWAPTIIFRMGHAPGLSLGRTTCFRSLSRHYALCHGGDGCGGCETELEADGHGVGAQSHLIGRLMIPLGTGSIVVAVAALVASWCDPARRLWSLMATLTAVGVTV